MDKPKTVIAIGIKPGGASEGGDETQEGVNVPEPKGWSWPDGVDPKEGDKFMCSVVAGPDGMLTIKDIDGLPLGENEDEEPEAKPEPPSPMETFMNGKKALSAA